MTIHGPKLKTYPKYLKNFQFYKSQWAHYLKALSISPSYKPFSSTILINDQDLVHHKYVYSVDFHYCYFYFLYHGQL